MQTITMHTLAMIHLIQAVGENINANIHLANCELQIHILSSLT